LHTKIVDEGSIVDSFGELADTLCNQALEEFIQSAPDAGDDAAASAVYDKKLQELESALDAPLQVLYFRLLALLREKALETYRSASRVTETSDYEAMLQTDSQFSSAAQEATREGSDWDYSAERSHLQSIMNDIASTRKKLMDVQIKSSEKQSTAMAFLQQQQQMIQQLQMQLYGQSSPWNLGVAYRIPDTNFNLQGSYQQGRANIQLSCVPDEYAPMLGANGFTNGVGPGNLGLSLNLSL
jgi:Root hair defective 3 GTP-binding protein (RHD3).